MSLFTNDVDTISDALNNSFAVVIQTFIQVAGTLLLLFILNWRLSLLVVVGYIAMFWYINYSTQRSRAFYARQQASLGELDAYMEEMIAGQKVVKVFNHQQADMAAFAARNEKLREAGTGAQSYAATMIPAVVSIGYLNYAVIAVVGGLMVMWGWSDLGSLASYLVFVRQTTLPINQLTQQGNFLLAALAGAERIFTVMEEKPEIDEGTVELVSVRENSDGTLTECAGSTGRWAWCDRRRPDVPLEPLHGDVRFHDVSFGYTPDRMILQNLSLYAKPGQKIAFVGSTGAGKTTITNLINRFYEVVGRVHHLRRHGCAAHQEKRPAPLAGRRACRTPTCSPARWRTTSASASWTPRRREIEKRPQRLPTPTPSSAACRRATTRW